MTGGGARVLDVALLQPRAFGLADHEAAWAELLRRIDEAAAPPHGAPPPALIVAPEASYPAYYLHSREAYEAACVLPDAEVEATLAERARRHGAAIVVGLVQRGPDGAPRNVAVCVGPDGEVLTRTAKRFLWHFDREWFEPGEGGSVVEVGGARAGVFICADARLPEIPRALAAAGAELLIDPTAWVVERARRGRALQPAGRLHARRARDRERRVDRRRRQGRRRGGHDRLRRTLRRRRPRRALARPSAERRARHRPRLHRPRTRRAARPSSAARSCTAAGPCRATRRRRRARAASRSRWPTPRCASRRRRSHRVPSAVELLEEARSLAAALATQGAQLLVLPDLARADPQAPSRRELLPQLEALSAEAGLMIAVTLAEHGAANGGGGRAHKTMLLLDGGALIASHRQAHLDAAERAAGFAPGDVPPPVLDTRLGRIGLLAGGDALAPETARALKLAGGGGHRVVRPPR